MTVQTVSYKGFFRCNNCFLVLVNFHYKFCRLATTDGNRLQKNTCYSKVLEQYKSVGAELNVMPYCSQFIPLEVKSNSLLLTVHPPRGKVNSLLLTVHPPRGKVQQSTAHSSSP